MTGGNFLSPAEALEETEMPTLNETALYWIIAWLVVLVCGACGLIYAWATDERPYCGPLLWWEGRK